LIDQPKSSHADTRDQIIEAALRLFFEQGYRSTGIAQIRKAAGANSGSLYHFFPSKEALLAAVLEKYKATLGPQILEPAYQQVTDPIQRVFAILDGYRKLLRATNFRLGCPMGSLALEVSNDYADVRRQIVQNLEKLCGAIERLIKDASDRLPAKMSPASLARHVLATMEGGVMLARAYRSLEPFDQAMNHLKDYFDRLLKDRAEFESKRR
jgi:TetR/AcrR family transcriptional regulator, transcriptional repressor for nem operon